MTAERERAANRGGPWPRAKGWGGGQPRGTRGARRGSPVACSPEHTRVKRPAHRIGSVHMQPARTERNVHSDMWRCVRACEETGTSAPNAHDPEVLAHYTRVTRGLARGEAGARAAPDCGHEWSWYASQQPHTEPRHCHTDMCTPKALFMQEAGVPRAHSQRHTETNTMQICAQCRYVCSVPAAQSGQQSFVELKPTHPPSYVHTFYAETLPRKASHSTNIRPTLTQTQPAMCTDTPTSPAGR